MDLAKRSITAATWNSLANWISLIILFGRAILLARWLPVDTFGIYAMAFSIVQMGAIFAEFGMAGAYLHRAEETKDESKTAAVHFTLKLIFTLILVALLTLFAFLFTDGELRIALIVLTFTTGITQLTQTPRRILARRVIYRRLAFLQLANATFTTIVALGLAWNGATLWALLASNILNSVLSIFILYIWKPVWKPRLAWSPSIMRYFLHFGSRNFLASLLYRALDRLDDLWVGYYLGATSLGYYAKAYNFATYPRKLIALPINPIAGATYAELKGDRVRLSQAFFRVNALLIRSGFYLAGLLALIAPEFISIVLGEKWMPMLGAFRVMLAFTLLDPIKVTMGHLFVAVGKPEKLINIRLAQLALLIAGLYIWGFRWGIEGVAIAVNFMLVLGIMLLFYYARPYVDVSIKKLFLIPTFSLTLGLLLSYILLTFPESLTSDWQIAIIKSISFTLVYFGVLILFERENLYLLSENFKKYFPAIFGSKDNQ